MPRLLTYQTVEQRFLDRNFNLITENYTGDTQKLEYFCKCGCKAVTTMNQLRKGEDGCKICANIKRKKTFLDKYGTDHPQKCKTVQNKTKQTCLDRYGVDNPSKDPNIIKKIQQTWTDRYGDHPMHIKEFRDKQKNKMIKNYGVDNPMKNKQVQEKQRETCLKKYGVDNPMKHPEFFHKAMNSFEKKEYIFPSGDKVYIQGYENHALDILLNKYDEKEILVGDKNKLPVITYTYDGKSCKFYPDIYVPHKNKIIEVKSTFTYLRFQQKNKIKLIQTSIQGYIIEFWIFDKKGELVELITVC